MPFDRNYEPKPGDVLVGSYKGAPVRVLTIAASLDDDGVVISAFTIEGSETTFKTLAALGKSITGWSTDAHRFFSLEGDKIASVEAKATEKAERDAKKAADKAAKAANRPPVETTAAAKAEKTKRVKATAKPKAPAVAV